MLRSIVKQSGESVFSVCIIPQPEFTIIIIIIIINRFV